MTRWPLRRYKGYAGTNCSNEGDNYLLWKTKSQNLSHNVSEKGCQKKKGNMDLHGVRKSNYEHGTSARKGAARKV
jgi:hypothetical protein